MSHEPSHSTEHMSPPPAQAAEGIAWGTVLGIGITSLLICVFATWFALHLLRVQEKALQPMGPDPIPLQIGQGEIGIVDQAPFDVTRSLEAYRRDRNARLESWGWTDRKAGLVHMPIEKAMDAVVKEHAR